ncbi:hypothetical protein [Prosthecobacter sp.]|jgi:hypothetical protein|uniref:DUF7133 domain-containing protein n=1 Tax=Prosthecobacter sp. TaxID=1965333 RepID=UPI0037CC64A6
MDGKGEELPSGRVVVLEDTDHDGRMDKNMVFATTADRREAWVQDQLRAIP